MSWADPLIRLAYFHVGGVMKEVAYIELEMNDGSKVNMSTAMINLYKLREKNMEAYETLNNIIMNGHNDDLSTICDMFYASYLCANIDQETMTKDEFIEKFPYNYTSLLLKSGQLMGFPTR